MRAFALKNPTSIDETINILQSYGKKARILAGGSDLIGALKSDIWMEYPEVIINIKNIPELTGIRLTSQGIEIASLTTLANIGCNADVNDACKALAVASNKTASPLLRNIATIGGNICQENRCWYYRYPNKLGGRIPCMRKGGKKCFAIPGDHRYHSIFGVVNRCIAVNPSDTAPAIIALDGSIITNKRLIKAEMFFSAELGAQSTVLESDEIVLKILIPHQPEGSQSAFSKIAHRQSIDFALVNCATALSVKEGIITSARICLNAVYNIPLRATSAEEYLVGKAANENLLAEAAYKAIENAKPLLANGYKVNMVRMIVEDTLKKCLE